MAGVCVWSRYEELWKAYLATVAEDGGALLPGLPTLVPMGSGNVQGSHPTQIHTASATRTDVSFGKVVCS